MNSARAIPGAGLLLVLLIAAGQSLHDGSELRIGGVGNIRIEAFVALQALAAATYLFAVTRLLRRPDAAPLWLVLAIAVAMRLIPLASPMFLSSDLFRYVWDGRVQLAGINPYRYLPADPALVALRDTVIYPHINRAATARTIYPPMAELAFAVIAWFGQTPLVMRSAMVGFEALAAVCLAVALRRLSLPRGRLLIYAWNPLPVWEFAGNGHLDAMVVAFSAAALLASAQRRRAVVGVMLAAATLVKFLPAAIVPAFWRRWDWRLPLAGGLAAIALYACYLGAGRGVLGFLPGYAAEEGVNDGSGFWLLEGLGLVTPLPGWAGPAFVLAVAAALAAAAWTFSRAEHDAVRTAALAGALATFTMVALSPHYPWYYAWISVFAVISPQRSGIYLSAAALLLYIDPTHVRFAWRALVFAPVIALSILDLKRPLLPNGERRWTSP